MNHPHYSNMPDPSQAHHQQQQQQSAPLQAASSFSNPHLQYLSTQSIPQRTSSAPLPSPTQQRPPFFSSLTTSSVQSSSTTASSPFVSASSASMQSQGQAMYGQQQQQQAHQFGANVQAQQQQQGYAYGYAPDRGNAGSTAQETRGLIDNFALVAEAAKRAQMAVLMRDMEGVELT